MKHMCLLNNSKCSKKIYGECREYLYKDVINYFECKMKRDVIDTVADLIEALKQVKNKKLNIKINSDFSYKPIGRIIEWEKEGYVEIRFWSRK